MFNSKWQKTVKSFNTDNSNKYIIEVPLDTDIQFVALDMDGKITDATTKQYMVIKKTGAYDYNESLMSLNVDAVKDSALVYIIHHWIAPERTYYTPKNIKLSSDRYWTVDGIIPPGFHATAQISYDGRAISFQQGSSPNGGYLDNDFLKNVPEDSIVLMFRPLISIRGTIYPGEWQQMKDNTDYIKTMGAKTDEFGHFKILNLKKGQYCFGVYDKNAGVKPILPDNSGFDLYPNPAANSLHIKFKDPHYISSLQVYDIKGKKVKNYTSPSPASNDFSIPNLNLAMGTYILEVSTNEGISCKKFVVEQ